jgi:16S rRNA (guanine527-N7)-methyltransferase
MQAEKENELRNILLVGSEKLGVCLGEDQLLKFLRYLCELRKQTERINVSGIIDEKEIIVKHFLDSLSCLIAGKIKPEDCVVDIGSGAGFPGIPLKIAINDLKLTLVESVRKKAEFLSSVSDKLGLKDVEIVNKRIEDFVREGKREKYNIAITRAVSSLPVLLEYALPSIKVNGYFLALKGPKVKEEIISSKKAIEELRGEIEALLKVEVPYLNRERFIVVVRKKESTPLKYPRRAGIAKKRSI